MAEHQLRALASEYGYSREASVRGLPNRPHDPRLLAFARACHRQGPPQRRIQSPRQWPPKTQFWLPIRMRLLFNHAFFTRIFISDEGPTTSELAPPFRNIIGPAGIALGLEAFMGRKAKNPVPAYFRDRVLKHYSWWIQGDSNP
jgi:hypothetical protein